MKGLGKGPPLLDWSMIHYNWVHVCSILMKYTKISAQGSMDKFTLTITNVTQPLVYKHGWMYTTLNWGGKTNEGMREWKRWAQRLLFITK
jgi:hypothetical protein